MTDRVYRVSDLCVFECAADSGPLLGSEQAALDVTGGALGHQPDWVVITVARLDADFFRLDTRLAGGIVQKFVNYGLRLAIVGDTRATSPRAPLSPPSSPRSNRAHAIVVRRRPRRVRAEAARPVADPLEVTEFDSDRRRGALRHVRRDQDLRPGRQRLERLCAHAHAAPRPRRRRGRQPYSS